MAADPQPAFAVWITGLPASGKSTLADALRGQLAKRGVGVAVLESDALRPILAPGAAYSPQDRDSFYRRLAGLGALLAESGVPVIFDATANLRRYRNDARARIAHFLEVYVETPLETCVQRDPKGIYRQSREGTASSVPGVQAAYEPPARPEITVRGDEEPAAAAARRIVGELERRGFLTTA